MPGLGQWVLVLWSIQILAGYSHSLPIVDLSAPIEDAAEQLRTSALDHGFFYVTGHGISTDFLSSVFDQSRAFFALPIKEKLKMKQSEDAFGYTAYEEEVLDRKLQYDRGDTKEGYYLFREADESELGLPMRLPNQLPNATVLPHFYPIIKRYFNSLETMGHSINRIIAYSLGLDSQYFAAEGMFDKPMAALRLLHYTNELSNPDSGLFGAGAHTDYGMTTILATDGTPGLQMWDHNTDQWLGVDSLANAFVVNIGDQLQRWTNDRYKSTLHRVITVEAIERYSIAFFFEPNFDCLVECVPTICDVNSDDPTDAPKYAPITHGEHLMLKFTEGHSDLQTDDDITHQEL